MENLTGTNGVVGGKIYMVEIHGRKIDSYRVLAETPTHFIFSISNDASVEVFETAKKDIVGIFEVKDWVNTQTS